MADYFVPYPVYDDDFFHHRYAAIILGCINGLEIVGVEINHSYVPMFSGSE
jgi:hypothetical protein